MKVGLLASPLMTHYQQGTTTLAMCWRVTLTDDTVLGFTSFDRDLEVDGLTYLARSGFEPSAVESRSKLAADNAEQRGLLDSEVITVEDLAAGRWDYARVSVFVLNWSAPEDGVDILLTGWLGQVKLEDGAYSAELRGLASAYAATLGELYSPSCRAQFGDARCGVDLSPWTVTGTVEAVNESGQVLSDSTRTEPGPPDGKAIAGITRANPAVVHVPAHGFVRRQVVYIAGVAGMAQINGQFYVVREVLDVDHVSLDGVDSTDFAPYASGGVMSQQGAVGYFDGGKLTMTSGASAGLVGEVKAYSEGTITLQVEFPRAVVVGDTYELVAGCGKRFREDCVERFANGVNFRGEPHLPGVDHVLQVGDQ